MIFICSAGIASIWIGYGLYKVSMPFLASPLWSEDYRLWSKAYSNYKECIEPFEQAMHELLGDNSVPVGAERWATTSYKQDVEKTLKGIEGCGTAPERPPRVYFWD